MPRARQAHDSGVSLAVHLLGAPAVETDLTPAPSPRGRKEWALLAYLVLSGRAAPREELASLLFGEAEDPLGALRWNLAELRRVLGLPDALQGSPVRVELPPGAFVDVRALKPGAAVERLEHAFALGCQLRDCCWEGPGAAGLGLVEEAHGNVPGALHRLEGAARRSVREPDASLFGHAFVLHLLCDFAVRHQVGRAAQWVGDLERLAARTTMREFLVRAYLYRHDSLCTCQGDFRSSR